MISRVHSLIDRTVRETLLSFTRSFFHYCSIWQRSPLLFHQHTLSASLALFVNYSHCTWSTASPHSDCGGGEYRRGKNCVSRWTRQQTNSLWLSIDKVTLHSLCDQWCASHLSTQSVSSRLFPDCLVYSLSLFLSRTHSSLDNLCKLFEYVCVHLWRRIKLPLQPTPLTHLSEYCVLSADCRLTREGEAGERERKGRKRNSSCRQWSDFSSSP